jgi:hypothetical protein
MTYISRRKRQITVPNGRATRCKRLLGSRAFLLVLGWIGFGVLGTPPISAGTDPGAAGTATVSSTPVVRSSSKLRWVPYNPRQEASPSKVKAAEYRTAGAVQRHVARAKSELADHFNRKDFSVRPVQAEEVPLPPAEPLVKPSAAPIASQRAESSPSVDPESSLRWAAPRPVTAPLNPPVAEQMPTKTVTVDKVPYTEPAMPETFEPESIPTVDDQLRRRQLEPDLCLSVKSLIPITKLTTDIRMKVKKGADVPHECPWGENEVYKPRSWEPVTFCWTASALCHKPLYFEDVHLERYGHSLHPWAQPFASGAHFFLTVPILPYKMGLELPTECIYTLGFYRPGSCAPYMIEPLPLSVRAGLFEACAWVGGAALIP